ncbi:TraY domain-containing protein [Providencia heimbachae]|uniref:TraY domain-containing protein n=1 Tax=Providencia heimbachae TaxID=333962 RepID=UPI002240525C|nr:TraY domain-containing protein [Providencia heimbachae]
MNANKHKKITVDISLVTEERLVKAIQVSGRSKKDEIRLRLAHSLKNIEKLEDNYWELISI